MADPVQAKGIVDQCIAKMGRVDILVNNAAAGRGKDRVPVTELEETDWHRVLDVKLNGSFYASKAAAQHMVKQGDGGSIIMISSITGKLHGAYTAAYTVANIGLQGLAGCLSKELGPYNINVNAICPGIIDTARMDALGRGERWRKAEKSVPMQRAGQPQDVAAVILFLCSQEGRWTSGQSINVDGGQVSSH
jgi:3-oxoacyl-[acyl-carrier protein] reductase/meso-butanediol dehydrogenase/(S,S)-butanediol dehydrogenase/diacetyl reductase